MHIKSLLFPGQRLLPSQQDVYGAGNNYKNSSTIAGTVSDIPDYCSDELLSQHSVISAQLKGRAENCSILMGTRRERWSGAGISHAGFATKEYTLCNYTLQIKCYAFMPFLFSMPLIKSPFPLVHGFKTV